MNSDATEAALGLLGLSPFNAPQAYPQPQPHHHVAHAHGPTLTSSSVGIAVDRTSTPPVIQTALPPSLVPLKRKQPSPALPSATAAPLTPGIPGDAPSIKSPHPLAASSTPPIKSNRPLPSLSTKSLTAPSEQRPFSPVLSGSVPPQTPPTSQLSLPSPSTSQLPHALSDVPPPPDSDAISCICGFTYDDGFSIACDDCSRWCHAACFGIVQGGVVPEFWKCWICDPALVVDKERAVKIQKGRLKNMRMKASNGANGVSGATGVNGIGGSTADEGSGGVGKPASRRKTSPGAERKSRRGSAVAAAIEGSGSSRKKRRASMLSPTNPSSPSIPSANHISTQSHAGSSRLSHPNGNSQVTSESLPPTPVTFPPDVYSNPAVYAQLLRVAKAWRGVTALNPPSPLISPPPKAYNNEGYMRVDSQGYQDRYGYSMSPLDNTTPVIMDENAGDVFVPRTVLRTNPPASCSNLYLPASTTCMPAHLRPPSPRLHVASDPSPFSHTSIYPSPPMSNYTSTPVPSSSQPRLHAKSPLTPSTNIFSSNSNDTIPATTLLAPYTAAIVPSAAYLADPLNAYAHLGMGKPQVRLVGGGWEVGLDSRGVGGVPDSPVSAEQGSGVTLTKENAVDGKAKWARCGCWPNAVVRPIICSDRKKSKAMWHKAECAKATADGDGAPNVDGPSRKVDVPPTPMMQGQQAGNSSDQDDAPSSSDSDPTTLSFALFALRDLRADEEIVLGWEWDDGHAVHMLPALMESPGMFAPAHLHHLRAQFTSILHALSSTFTTCACGSSTRDCAVRVMEQVVEGRWPWPGAETTSEGSEGNTSDVNVASEDEEDDDVDVEGDGELDPRPARNWGLGVDVDVDIQMDGPNEVHGRTGRAKRRKVRKKSKVENPTHVSADKDASIGAPSSTSKPKTRKAIDLGPLVGAKRGFQTREKDPMNGGWGGVEIVPSSLRASPQVGKGGDPYVVNKGKGKARVADDTDRPDVGPSSSTLPPRMRKAWFRPPTNSEEPSQENIPQDYSTRAESWRSHERWRSPADASAESPTSVSSMVVGNSGSDRGGDRKQGSTSAGSDGQDGADGQETEFDTETEADGSDDTRQMPPPPMPASLDPTTVSSLAHAVRGASPRGSIQWDKNGVTGTRVPPQTSASSGRPNPSPSQGAPPALHSATAHAVSSQVNHGTQSMLSSQSQSIPLASSASPSVTFSKLSLHSPDASFSPHLSLLGSPIEPRLSSSAFASTLPAHRPPSKPLHVHPHNELPFLHVSLSAPAVTLDSTDGTRDTPAETQYQQPYRSSPETRHDPHPLFDTEKRRPTNGEAYRVRFASPEVLNGLPQLRGRVPSDGSAHNDEYTANARAIGAVKEQELSPLDRDGMDIEVDVVGDNLKEDDGRHSHEVSPESQMDDVKDACLSLRRTPESPRAQAPPGPMSHGNLSVEDGITQADDIPLTGSNVDETGSQAELIIVDQAVPALSAREPSPPPPPPPKVKMSLKDFALRKKKQREEEMAAKALGSPVTPDGPVLPPSPGVDFKRDLAGEHAGTSQIANSVVIAGGEDVKMNDVTKEDGLDSPGTPRISVNGVDGGERNAVGDLWRTEEKPETSAGDIELPGGEQVPYVTVARKSPPARRSSPRQSARSSTVSSRVLGERDNTGLAQLPADGKSSTTFAAKMEILDAIVPNGLFVDDPVPHAVSFAPEPPPPPLTTKQTSETTTIDLGVPAGSMSKLVPQLNPTPVSTPTSMSTSTSTSTVNSRSNSVGIPAATSNPNLSLGPHGHVSSSSSIPASRRASHEDGEITSSTPPKAYMPRSHTPPTQPRSFHASPPAFGSSSSSTAPTPRRPAPPLSRSPLSTNAGPPSTPISSRPLPSGPRALRGSMSSQSTHPYPSTRPSYSGSQYIPRGPSADRDRMDWERSDRPWAAQPRSRGRTGSNGWGR